MSHDVSLPRAPKPRTAEPGDYAAGGESPGDLGRAPRRHGSVARQLVAPSIAKMPPRARRASRRGATSTCPTCVTPADVPRRLPQRPRLPRRVPVHARRPADDVPRQASGRCACSPASARPSRPTRASTTCSQQGQTGLSTAFDFPTLDGLRLRLAALARRGRHVRRRGRHAPRHGGAVRRHPARQGHDVDDDQRPGDRPARVLRRARRQARHRRARRSAAPSRTTASRSSSRSTRGSSRRARRCASSPT